MVPIDQSLPNNFHDCNRIVLIGSDKDIIFETLKLSNKIIGYTSSQMRNDIVYPFWGDIKDLGPLGENFKLLVTVDDIAIRNFCLEKYESHLLTYISPFSRVSPLASIGKGSFIQSGCFVSSNVVVGHCSKINVGAQLHHDSFVGDCSIIAPGAIILGNSRVGNRTYIGAGSLVKERLSIGDDCIIGMGSNVITPITDNSLAFGNPCRMKNSQ